MEKARNREARRREASKRRTSLPRRISLRPSARGEQTARLLGERPHMALSASAMISQATNIVRYRYSNKQHALHFCSCCWCSWMCHRPSRYTRTALLPLSAERALLLILVQEFIAAILCSPSIVAFDLRGYNPRRIPIDRSAPRLRESKSCGKTPSRYPRNASDQPIDVGRIC